MHPKCNSPSPSTLKDQSIPSQKRKKEKKKDRSIDKGMPNSYFNFFISPVSIINRCRTLIHGFAPNVKLNRKIILSVGAFFVLCVGLGCLLW